MGEPVGVCVGEAVRVTAGVTDALAVALPEDEAVGVPVHVRVRDGVLVAVGVVDVLAVTLHEDEVVGVAAALRDAVPLLLTLPLMLTLRVDAAVALPLVVLDVVAVASAVPLCVFESVVLTVPVNDGAMTAAHDPEGQSVHKPAAFTAQHDAYAELFMLAPLRAMHSPNPWHELKMTYDK